MTRIFYQHKLHKSVAIFLPSFFFVAILNPIIPKLRPSRYAAAFRFKLNGASLVAVGALLGWLAGLL